MTDPRWNAPQQPMPPTPPTPHVARRPWWKSLWFLVAVGVIVGIGIGAASASGNSKKSTPAAAKTDTSTVTATATATATAEATVTTTPVVRKVIATRVRTHTVTYTPPPKPAINDGTYKVGRDIKPGEWRTGGGGDCYYERDRNLSGGFDAIIDNDNFDGGSLVQLEPGNYFKISGGCEWRHV